MLEGARTNIVVHVDNEVILEVVAEGPNAYDPEVVKDVPNGSAPDVVADNADGEVDGEVVAERGVSIPVVVPSIRTEEQDVEIVVPDVYEVDGVVCQTYLS